jgi:hypothetical protein
MRSKQHEIGIRIERCGASTSAATVGMKPVREINGTLPPTVAGTDHDLAADLAGGRLSRRG